MRVAIIDVGSETIRLLVARVSRGTLVPVGRDRVTIGLGEAIDRGGEIGGHELDRVAAECSEFSRIARALGATRARVIATGAVRRAGNSQRLLATLSHATGLDVRVLSPDQEGLLSFTGALARASWLVNPVAVCDVGPDSTEVAVGTTDGGASYVRSAQIGALRLARLLPEERPAKHELRQAYQHVRLAFDRFVVPLPKSALAAGATAQGLRKLVGRSLDASTIDQALRIVSTRAADELIEGFGVPPHRVRTLAPGALILREVHRRVAVPLEVARGGIREGAALELLAQADAA